MAIGTTSCSKDDEKTKSPTEKKLLGSWQKTKIESKLPGGDWVDESASHSCQLDDVEEYQQGGKWLYYSGAILCEGGSGLVYTGTWRLAASDTKVIFTYEDASGEYESNIENITDSQLVFTFATGLTNNSQRRVTYTKK